MRFCCIAKNIDLFKVSGSSRGEISSFKDASNAWKKVAFNMQVSQPDIGGKVQNSIENSGMGLVVSGPVSNEKLLCDQSQRKLV